MSNSKPLALTDILDQHKVKLDVKTRVNRMDDEYSSELVKNMAEMGMTMTMMAGCFGVSLRTFKRRLNDFPEIREAFYAGRAKGITGVQNTAFALAKTGLDPMTTRWYLDKYGGAMETDVEAMDQEESDIIDISSNKSGPMTQEELKTIVGEAFREDPMLKEDDEKSNDKPDN